jgi:hypothetical protein
VAGAAGTVPIGGYGGESLPDAYRAAPSSGFVQADLNGEPPLRVIDTPAVLIYFANGLPTYMRLLHPTTRCAVEFDAASLNGHAARRTGSGVQMSAPEWGTVVLQEVSSDRMRLELGDLRGCGSPAPIDLFRSGRGWEARAVASR